MKSHLLLFCLLASGCLQPMHRYALSPLMGTDDERATALARAFAAAGMEPEIVDPRLGMVATAWQTPYGSNQGTTWTRRWVAIVAPTGAVTLRADIKICRLFAACSDIVGEGAQQDVDALDAFAQGLGQALGGTVTVIP